MSGAARWRLAWLARSALQAALWALIGATAPASWIINRSNALLERGFDALDRLEEWGRS